jgi:hypothetical protein
MTRDDSPNAKRTLAVIVVLLLIAIVLLARCERSPLLLVAPPKPIFLDAPLKTTHQRTATFSYTDEWHDVTYKCSLDRIPLKKCPSEGMTFRRLKPGPHVFSLAAKKGRLLSERAKWHWKIVEPGNFHSGTTTTTTPGPTTPTATPTPTPQTGSTLDGSFAITGNVEGVLAPGVMRAVNVSFTNPWDFRIAVSSLEISVRDTTFRNGGPNPGCIGSVNLLVIRPLGTQPRIPPHRTRSLAQLGVPQSQWPVVYMPNLPTNQDACKSTTFSLRYSGTAVRP